MFAAFDPAGEGRCDYMQVVLGLGRFVEGSLRQRLEFLFDAYDTDGSGRLELLELMQVILSGRAVSGPAGAGAGGASGAAGSFLGGASAGAGGGLDAMTFASELARMLDSDGDNVITREEFVSTLEKEPVLMECLGDSLTAQHYAAGPRFDIRMLQRIAMQYSHVPHAAMKRARERRRGSVDLSRALSVAGTDASPRTGAAAGDEEGAVTLLDRCMSQSQFQRLMSEVFDCPSDALPLAARVFRLFDADGGGSVDLRELYAGMLRATRGSLEERAEFFFQLFDEDGSGTLDMDEIKSLLLYAQSRKLAVTQDDARHVIRALDADGNGSVDLAEWVTAIRRSPSVLRSVSRVFGQTGLFPDEEEGGGVLRRGAAAVRPASAHSAAGAAAARERGSVRPCPRASVVLAAAEGLAGAPEALEALAAGGRDSVASSVVSARSSSDSGPSGDRAGSTGGVVPFAGRGGSEDERTDGASSPRPAAAGAAGAAAGPQAAAVGGAGRLAAGTRRPPTVRRAAGATAPPQHRQLRTPAPEIVDVSPRPRASGGSLQPPLRPKLALPLAAADDDAAALDDASRTPLSHPAASPIGQPWTPPAEGSRRAAGHAGGAFAGSAFAGSASLAARVPRLPLGASGGPAAWSPAHGRGATQSRAALARALSSGSATHRSTTSRRQLPGRFLTARGVPSEADGPSAASQRARQPGRSTSDPSEGDPSAAVSRRPPPASPPRRRSPSPQGQERPPRSPRTARAAPRARPAVLLTEASPRRKLAVAAAELEALRRIADSTKRDLSRARAQLQEELRAQAPAYQLAITPVLPPGMEGVLAPAFGSADARVLKSRRSAAVALPTVVLRQYSAALLTKIHARGGEGSPAAVLVRNARARLGRSHDESVDDVMSRVASITTAGLAGVDVSSAVLSVPESAAVARARRARAAARSRRLLAEAGSASLDPVRALQRGDGSASPRSGAGHSRAVSPRGAPAADAGGSRSRGGRGADAQASRRVLAGSGGGAERRARARWPARGATDDGAATREGSADAGQRMSLVREAMRDWPAELRGDSLEQQLQAAADRIQAGGDVDSLWAGKATSPRAGSFGFGDSGTSIVSGRADLAGRRAALLSRGSRKRVLERLWQQSSSSFGSFAALESEPDEVKTADEPVTSRRTSPEAPWSRDSSIGAVASRDLAGGHLSPVVRASASRRRV